MIDPVSPANTAAVTPNASGPSSARTLYHTPFGDVMGDEMATPYGLSSLVQAANLGPAPALQNGAGPAPATPQSLAAPAQPADAPQAPAASSGTATPSLQSEFGKQPYLDHPTGTGVLGSFDYNPIYFATRATADKIAALLGGTVVEQNDMVTGGPFSQSAPNEMIKLADGRMVNAGLIANFYSHGYPQSYIDSLIQKEIQGSDTI